MTSTHALLLAATSLGPMLGVAALLSLFAQQARRRREQMTLRLRMLGTQPLCYVCDRSALRHAQQG